MTETIHYDDTPTPVATRPIERRRGVAYIGGTTTQTQYVYRDYLATGRDVFLVARLYGLPVEQIQAAIDYEADVTRRRACMATRPIERRGGIEYVGGSSWSVDSILRHLDAGMTPSAVAMACGLPVEAVDYVQRRRMRKAKRKDPVARKLKANGRACKQRGAKAERGIVATLGPQWERVPLSGALGGRHAGDVRYIGDVPVPAVRVLEVKRRRGGMATLTRWLAQGGGVDGVVIDPANGSGRLWVFDELAALRLLDGCGLRAAAPDDAQEPITDTRGGR